VKHTITIPTGALLAVFIVGLLAAFIEKGLAYALGVPHAQEPSRSLVFLSGVICAEVWRAFR
jgi:hypothetical protein